MCLLMSSESVMPSNHLILCYPPLILPSIFPRIRVFSNKSALHIRWPNYWSFSLSINPSNEYSGLISFRMDWMMDKDDLLAVQGTLKSLLQNHTVQKHQFFTSGGQTIGVWNSASVLPMSIQDWLPLGLAGLISLPSKDLSRIFFNITVPKHQFFGTQPSHIHTWLLEKP